MNKCQFTKRPKNVYIYRVSSRHASPKEEDKPNTLNKVYKHGKYTEYPVKEERGGGGNKIVCVPVELNIQYHDNWTDGKSNRTISERLCMMMVVS